MKEYFIHNGQKEVGPFNLENLKLQPLKKETSIWFEGLENWTTVGEVDELKSFIKIIPPPLNKTNASSQKPLQIPILQPNSIEQNIIEPRNKKLSISFLFILAIILIGGIIGWLIYQNKNLEQITLVQEIEKRKQDSVINDVTIGIAKKKEEEIQKVNQILIDDQQKKTEKDSINAIISENNMGYRNNWSRYIAVTSNKFSSSDWGGITDLAVIVYNKTDKKIDEIQVEVDYIKSNGGVFKTEFVSVMNVGPSSSKLVSAPSSERGTSIQMRIQSISAKSFNFCYPSGKRGNRNIDPYFCN